MTEPTIRSILELPIDEEEFVDPFLQPLREPEPVVAVPEEEEDPAFTSFIDDPEGKEDEPQDRIQQTREHLRASQLEPFQTPEFNVETMVAMLDTHIDELGDVADADQFANDFLEIAIGGVEQALDSGDRDAVNRAINTITEAATEFAEGTNEPEKIRRLTEDLIDEVTKGVEDERLVRDVEIDAVVDEIFGDELQALRARELSPEEISAIQSQLSNDLFRTPRSRQELEDLIGYIDDKVEIESLRQALIAQVRDRLRSRAELEATGELVTRKPPAEPFALSSVKSLIIQKPIQAEFSREILEKADEWDHKLIGTRPDKKGILREVRQEVGRLNALFKRANIMRPGTQQVFKIKTSRQSAQGAINLLRDAAQNALGNPKNTFTYIPPVSRGAPQDITTVLAELKEILNRGPSGVHRPILTHPDRTSNFGSIVVTRQGDRREIVLGPGTPLSDIMKLAQALVMEPGRLEDSSGREQLEIDKDTKAGEVVSFIREIFENSVGQVARFLYVPHGLGEHVGGFLENVVMGGRLMPIRTSLDSHRMQRNKAGILTSTIGEYSRYGRKGGALPLAVGAAVLAKPIAGVADIIGKAVPPLKIITAPIKAVANIVSSIGKIFGF